MWIDEDEDEDDEFYEIPGIRSIWPRIRQLAAKAFLHARRLRLPFRFRNRG